RSGTVSRIARHHRAGAVVVGSRRLGHAGGAPGGLRERADPGVEDLAHEYRRRARTPGMTGVRPAMAAPALTLAALRDRAAASLVVVVGITGVVAVLISVLALANGFRRTIESAARPDRVIVVSSGSESEGGSGLSRSAVDSIMLRDAVRKDAQGK